MSKKEKKAYLRGMIDLATIVFANGFMIWFAMDVIEKYFM